MTSRTAIKRLALLALSRMEGTPLEGSALMNSLALACTPRPTDSDCYSALRELEADGYVAGTRDDFTKQDVWALTAKGQIKANQIA